MALKKFGNFTVPDGDYADPVGNTTVLSRLIKKLRPSNVTHEPQISTVARVAARISNPVNGAPMFPGESGKNNGTVAAGHTVEEWGDGYNHVTRIRLGGALPNIPGGVGLALGKLVYTFPAGNIILSALHLQVSLKQTEGNITNDTPDMGLGTVLASGAVATLDLATAGSEDISSGVPMDDCDGTEEQVIRPAAGAGPILSMTQAALRTVYLNFADAWDDAAGGDSGALLGGSVWLAWQYLGNTG